MGSQVRALYRPPRRRGLHLFATTFFCFSKNASLSRSVATPLRRKDRSRRLGAFALRAAFSFSFLRCSLRSQEVKVKAILSDGALCAPSLISHFSFLILHCPFLAPPPRRELRSFCVGDVSFCSSVPRLRRGKRARAFADCTCSRRRFLFLKKTRHPCCGARLFRRSQRSLEKFDRGHSLAFLPPPPCSILPHQGPLV